MKLCKKSTRQDEQILQLETKVKYQNKKIQNLQKEIQIIKSKMKKKVTPKHVEKKQDYNGKKKSILNSFNKTDYSVLTKDDLIKALENGADYLLYIFRRCHIETPSNRNILLRKKKVLKFIFWKIIMNGN